MDHFLWLLFSRLLRFLLALSSRVTPVCFCTPGSPTCYPGKFKHKWVGQTRLKSTECKCVNDYSRMLALPTTSRLHLIKKKKTKSVSQTSSNNNNNNKKQPRRRRRRRRRRQRRQEQEEKIRINMSSKYPRLCKAPTMHKYVCIESVGWQCVCILYVYLYKFTHCPITHHQNIIR